MRFWGGIELMDHEWAEDISGDFEGPDSASEGLPEGIVFDLDAYGASVADLDERGDKVGPRDFTEARNARLMPFGRVGEAPDLVDLVELDGKIFGVNVKEFLAEFPQWGSGVHALEDKVGGIVV